MLRKWRAISLLTLGIICNPDQRALAGPLTCQEVPGEGLTSSKPTAATFSHWSIYIVNLFMRGLNNRIYQNTSSDLLRWSGWSEVQGSGLTISAPAAVVYLGRTLLFVRGYDNRIYLNKLDGTGWSEVPGGGLTLSAPAAVIDNKGLLRLFVRGSNNRVYENDSNDLAHWSGWSEVEGDGLTISDPASIVHNNQLFLFVRSYDNRIYQNKLDGAGWLEVPGNGLTVAGLSALVDYRAPNGTLRLFMTGVDDGVWENDFTGNKWSGWAETTDGALTPSGPAAVGVGIYNDVPQIYGQTEDGRIFECGF